MVYNLAEKIDTLKAIYGKREYVTDYSVGQIYTFLLFLHDKGVYEKNLNNIK